MSHGVIYCGGLKYSKGRPIYGLSNEYDGSLDNVAKYTGIVISSALITSLVCKIAPIQPQISYAIVAMTTKAIVNGKNPLKAAVEAGLDLITAKAVVKLIKENLPS